MCISMIHSYIKLSQEEPEAFLNIFSPNGRNSPMHDSHATSAPDTQQSGIRITASKPCIRVRILLCPKTLEAGCLCAPTSPFNWSRWQQLAAFIAARVSHTFVSVTVSAISAARETRGPPLRHEPSKTAAATAALEPPIPFPSYHSVGRPHTPSAPSRLIFIPQHENNIRHRCENETRRELDNYRPFRHAP
ncbi:hypothetical protein K431DRAFT_57290 [Polychaeton citri CBS 116435]|uniref:Uncharacterized protein n=1 Tax=Polychaeton citri CBS 116435 TaxID=1314669 RepID=A0A9P4QA17_9PEZI|nr:hypothetical protein K431DRAFT_57290 [Polychaeton citri CBS 116435]